MCAHVQVEVVPLPDFITFADSEYEKLLNVNNLKHLIPWTGSAEEWYSRYNSSQARYNFDYYGTSAILETMVNCRPVCYELLPRHISILRDIGALGVVHGMKSVRRMYEDEIAGICQDVQRFLDGYGTAASSKPEHPIEATPSETGTSTEANPAALAFPWFDDDEEPASATAAPCVAVEARPDIPPHKPLLAADDWKAGIFVRTNACSPKDALNNSMKPLHSLQECVEAVACSSRCQREFNSSPDAVHSLLFAPWQTYLDGSNEFRVFVHQGIVTAISQYVWHKSFPWMLNTDAITQAALSIVAFWHDQIAGIVPFTECIMDVAILDAPLSKNVKLIEFNPFGLEFASGSALFHWKTDADKLFSKTSSPLTDEVCLAFPGDKPRDAEGKVMEDLEGARSRQALQPVVMRVARPLDGTTT